MDTWKIISKIAYVFGIVLAVFAAIEAILTYEYDTVMYLPTTPAKFIEATLLMGMLPFIVAAILSFVVAAYSSHATRQATEIKEKTKTQTTETENTQEIESDKTSE